MDKIYSQILFLALSLSLTIIIPLSTEAVKADTLNPGIYSNDSSPFGVPYKGWIAKWWQWNVGIPTLQHPRDNYTAEKCTANQNGSVWFLPDILTGKEERTCTIPVGKAVLVPLLTGECENSEIPAKTDDELRQCASAGDDYGIVSATLDGHKIQNLEQYRTQTDFFDITIVKDNIFGSNAGTFKGIADGYFVFLEPLSAGNHDLKLTTSVVNPATPSYNYAAEVVYHLDIK